MKLSALRIALVPALFAGWLLAVYALRADVATTYGLGVLFTGLGLLVNEATRPASMEPPRRTWSRA